MIVNGMSKSSKIIRCKLCDYTTSRKSQYDRHILTLKHQNKQNDSSKSSKSSKNEWICDCGRHYKYDSGLYRHKKKCNYIKPLNNTECKELIQIKKEQEFKELKTLVIDVMKSNNDLQKQNHELQKQMLDVCKNIQPNISNSNNNNNTFNLNLFLNEQCKDAMNITDFINSVTLSLNDLENMGTSGYVNGISSIIIKELRGLDITKRPVHCSDAKRETLYVKDEDRWEKECPENTKIKKAIRTVEKKNIKLISEWTDKHPKFTNSTTRENDEYLQILIETMGGKGDYEKNKNKVIKNIAKEVIIEK